MVHVYAFCWISKDPHTPFTQQAAQWLVDDGRLSPRFVSPSRCRLEGVVFSFACGSRVDACGRGCAGPLVGGRMSGLGARPICLVASDGTAKCGNPFRPPGWATCVAGF